MVFSADFYGFADNSHLSLKRQVGGSNPEIQPQSKSNNTRNNIELDKREINGNGITETGFNAEGKGQTTRLSLSTLWCQLEDTVLLIGTLLLFDPVLFPKYEA